MKNKIIAWPSLNTNIASLLLRMLFGGLFVYFGYGKVLSYSEILPNFGDIIGIGPKLSFNLLIFAELICGFLVLIGFLTRLSVIPIFIAMVVAYFVAHAGDPLTSKMPAFIFLCLSPVVFILGSGKYSIDGAIFNSKNEKH